MSPSWRLPTTSVGEPGPAPAAARRAPAGPSDRSSRPRSAASPAPSRPRAAGPDALLGVGHDLLDEPLPDVLLVRFVSGYPHQVLRPWRREAGRRLVDQESTRRPESGRSSPAGRACLPVLSIRQQRPFRDRRRTAARGRRRVQHVVRRTGSRPGPPAEMPTTATRSMPSRSSKTTASCRPAARARPRSRSGCRDSRGGRSERPDSRRGRGTRGRTGRSVPEHCRRGSAETDRALAARSCSTGPSEVSTMRLSADAVRCARRPRRYQIHRAIGTARSVEQPDHGAHVACRPDMPLRSGWSTNTSPSIVLRIRRRHHHRPRSVVPRFDSALGRSCRVIALRARVRYAGATGPPPPLGLCRLGEARFPVSQSTR